MGNNSRLAFKYRGSQCLNCEHPLDVSEKYCPNCAQLNSTKRLRLLDVFDEFFSSIFSYDSRFRQTLKTLLLRPGKISMDFIQGKRMTYTNPFRFYLTVSVAFFILQGLISKVNHFTELRQTENKKNENGLVNFNFNETDSVNTAKNKEDILNKMPTAEVIDTLPFSERTSKKMELYADYYQATKQNNTDSAFIELKQPKTFFNRFLYKKVADFEYLTSNPGEFINYMRSLLPVISFFFLPVFAFVIWLIYSKKKYNYMDHLVFTFHVQTMFFFILFILAIVGIFFSTGVLTMLLFAYFAFYLYKALRKFYSQGRLITIIKFVFLNIMFLFLLSFGAIFAFLGSFLLF